MAKFKEADPDWYEKAVTKANMVVQRLRTDSTPSSSITTGSQLKNAEVRIWYEAFVSIIPKYDEYLQSQNVSLEERAKRISDLRHTARIEARGLMIDKEALSRIETRDLKLYGNKDGPTFESTLEKEIKAIKAFVNQSEYTQADEKIIRDAALERVIDSSQRPNQEVSERLLGNTNFRAKL